MLLWSWKNHQDTDLLSRWHCHRPMRRMIPACCWDLLLLSFVGYGAYSSRLGKCKWGDMVKAQMQMKGTGSQKSAGSSWIELDEAFCEFTLGHRNHSDSDQIPEMVDRLSSHFKDVGCVPTGQELLVQYVICQGYSTVTRMQCSIRRETLPLELVQGM